MECLSGQAGMNEPARGRSVRFRLLAIALLPMLVILPLLLGVAIYRWNARFDATLISKVNGDLTIAHQYLARILEKTGVQIRALGLSARFRDVEEHDPLSAVSDLLETSRKEIGLDFLYLMDANGKILASSPAFPGRPKSDWPIITSALSGEAPSAGIDIFGNDELAAISPDLAERARLDLVPTPNAVPTDRSTETHGMVVHAASRATTPGGAPAALVGGILLNQNLEFIDTINDLVYQSASLPEGSQGTATLFLDDVRISTNVRLFEGRRALGTRVSAAVRSAVMDEGRTWLDSAFVVNDWYISAYEPLVDSYGKRVGMLYVGFLQKPFSDAKFETLLIIALAFIVITAATRADLPALGAVDIHAARTRYDDDRRGRERQSVRPHQIAGIGRRDRPRGVSSRYPARPDPGARPAIARVERGVEHAGARTNQGSRTRQSEAGGDHQAAHHVREARRDRRNHRRRRP